MIEKLVLGTASFGIDNYGIVSKPKADEVLVMLDYAKSSSIKYLDTSSVYGNAEELINQSGAYHFNVISKLKPRCLDNVNYQLVPDVIEKELKGELQRLGLSKMWGYLFHTPEYIYKREAIDSLIKCKKIGLVENIGVSAYEPVDALYASGLKFDIIQVPYNVLDQGLSKTKFFQTCKERNIKVFGRSPLLQGILALPVDKIPEHLKGLTEHIVNLDKIANKYGLSRLEVCILFALNSEIDYLVFGVNNISQLMMYWTICTDNFDFAKCYSELKQLPKVDNYLVKPNLWKK